MGVSHKEYLIEGVQFHPESILTDEGSKIFANFIKKVEEHGKINRDLTFDEMSSVMVKF